MPKERLDILLVERKMVENRSQAQRIIMAGQVHVDGQLLLKAGTKISHDADIKIENPAQFVSRGGEKLAAALREFPIKISNKICADVGASTGGFTDCLLQNDAKRVYAVDVGKGILHWKLRQDERVVVMEQTNARYLQKLPEFVEIITVDASFISLKILLPVFKGWFVSDNILQEKRQEPENPSVIALIKPQFEAGRKQAARGKGVIRDSSVHQQVLMDIVTFAIQYGYRISGLCRSPLVGPKGNVEFFVWLVYAEKSTKIHETDLLPQFSEQPLEEMVAGVLE